MLSERLKSIIQLIEPTDVVYDLCCDHGDIGISAYESELAKNVYFNDQVADIIKRLKFKITNLYSYIPEGIFFEEKPAQLIKYKNNSTILLVGIGYDTIIKVLEQIPNDSTLIVCSHTKPIELRNYLKNRFKLIDELLIEENAQFYEILKIHRFRGKQLQIMGNYQNDAKFSRYLANLKPHYERKAKLGNDAFSKEILNIILLKQKEF